MAVLLKPTLDLIAIGVRLYWAGGCLTRNPKNVSFEAQLVVCKNVTYVKEGPSPGILHVHERLARLGCYGNGFLRHSLLVQWL